jgi:copper chaperone
MVIDLKVDGMSCGHCVRSVKEVLEAVPGVKSVSVTLEPGSARVEGEGVSAADLVAAVEEEGYRAQEG